MPKKVKGILLGFGKPLTPLVVLGALGLALWLTFPLQSLEAGTKAAVTTKAAQAKLRALLDTADQVLGQMSLTTGLPIRASLRKKIVGRPEIEKYLKDNLRAEYTAEEIHVQEATLRAFGLVTPDFNLENFLVKFYTEQAAGFYDPRTKTMYIADWVAPEMQEMVLAHELTHALQDQNYGLDKFMHVARDNDDATGARQAIAEGYAMAAMMQHALGPVNLGGVSSLEPIMARVVDQQLNEFPAFTSAPYFFRLQALFPYLQGMTFMQRGLARGGWKTLNTLFKNPPGTTKELFEPEIYFEHKSLPKISLPDAAPLSSAPGWRLLTRNTMGELGYYALLGQLISEDEAKRVALHWLADRYILYESAGPTGASGTFLLVSRTKWSSPEMALAFFQDEQTILQKKYAGLAPDVRSGADLFIAGVGASRMIVVRKDDEVTWVEGIPAAQVDVMLNYLKSL